MIASPTQQLSALYMADETAWLDETAEIIRAGRTEELDYEHLAEYLTDMANRDRREVTNRLKVLLAHLLKWLHQSDRRSRSWHVTILTQQDELFDDVQGGVLRNHAIEVLPLAYSKGVKLASIETGLDEAKFPAVCPWTLDEVVSPDFIQLIS